MFCPWFIICDTNLFFSFHNYEVTQRTFFFRTHQAVLPPTIYSQIFHFIICLLRVDGSLKMHFKLRIISTPTRKEASRTEALLKGQSLDTSFGNYCVRLCCSSFLNFSTLIQTCLTVISSLPALTFNCLRIQMVHAKSRNVNDVA